MNINYYTFSTPCGTLLYTSWFNHIANNIFFPCSSYTTINIELYKNQVEIACNGKSPGQQGTLHNLTVLIFHFRSSKKYYFCRNNHQAGSKKENSIFKSQLEGANQTIVKTVLFCVHVSLYLLTI